MRNRLAALRGAIARAVRYVVKDRHDALTYIGLGALTAGVAAEYGRGWAAIVFGAVLLLFAWKGLH
jgi:hypothetical protein